MEAYASIPLKERLMYNGAVVFALARSSPPRWLPMFKSCCGHAGDGCFRSHHRSLVAVLQAMAASAAYHHFSLVAVLQAMAASAACLYLSLSCCSLAGGGCFRSLSLSLSCCSLAGDGCFRSLSWYLFPQSSSFLGWEARTRAQGILEGRLLGLKVPVIVSLVPEASQNQRRQAAWPAPPNTSSGGTLQQATGNWQQAVGSSSPKHHAPAAAGSSRPEQQAAAGPSSRPGTATGHVKVSVGYGFRQTDRQTRDKKSFKYRP